MQVKKISEMPMINTIPKRTKFSLEELQGEYNYWRATKILQKMMDNNLITQAEFNKIDHLNRQSFSPLYVSLMP
jgi:hypothetical protein